MAFSPPPVLNALSNHSLQPVQLLHKLDSCQSMEELKQFQAAILKSKSLQTHQIFSKILSFCALSPNGDIAHAQSLLLRVENPTPSLYNAIIRGFSLSYENPIPNSLSLYREMLEKCLSLDSFVFPSLLKVLAERRALPEGEVIHAHVTKMGFEFDVYVRNSLMRFYAVCGEIDSAQKLFDRFAKRDLVSWTTLISGYAKLGYPKEAVRVFTKMVDENVRADEVTIVTVLSACSKLGDLELARKLHRYIDENEVKLDVFVGNALVDAYSKCSDIDSAYKFFSKMPERNVISWNSMMSGLVYNGEFRSALSLFRRMLSQGIEPDKVTLVNVLNACANLGALELGEWIYVYMNRMEIKADGFIGNALVDMYAKCGRINQAYEVFCGIVNRDVYTYTAMIVGFAMHGQGEKALDVFSEMLMAGVDPNEVTFIGLLSACSHARLVDMGVRYFEDMSRVYGLKPQIEHYGCMVDMFGRAGLLDEAQEFITTIPFEPDAFIWGSLLGACKIHGEVVLGETIAKRLLDLDPEEDGGYAVMSNIYASANRQRDAVQLRKVMRARKVKKTPGCSLIEIDGVIYEFRMGDKSHPRMREIYLMVDEIGRRLLMEGYTAPATNVLEYSLCHHSERLAIAFGLISTRPSTPLRIVKNLRVCDDCHSVTKAISRIYNREIVIRDRYRFHHFTGGFCSCHDFW